MEVLLHWLLSNLGWEGLKALLSKGGAADVRVLKQALRDAQDRNRELMEDRKLMEQLVEQRNMLGAKLLEARRRIVELETASLQTPTSPKKKKGS